MKRIKSMSTVLLTFATAVALSACGGNNGSNGSAASSNTGGAASSDAKVTVSITSWRAEASEQEFYKQLQAELNKTAPEIVIDYKPVKATEYNTSLNVALSTDTAADIIHLRPYAAGTTIADADYLEPIDDLKGLDVFTPEQLKAAQGSDGKQYGVPYMLSSTQVLYNKDIFAKYNLQEPKTWDEFIKLADTLKSNNVTPLAFGSKEGWVLSLMHGAIAPQFYGHDFVDKFLKGEAKLDSPEYISSIEALKSLQPYFPANFEGLSMEDIRTIFATGQAGMVIDGHFEIASIQALNPEIKIGAFAVPPVKEGDEPSVSTWVDGSFAINKNSKNKEAARKVLEFMTTKEYGSMILGSTKSPSPIPGVSTDDELVNAISDLASKYGQPYFAVTNLNSGNPTTKSTLETDLQGMFLDAMTPEQVAADVQKSADTWFK
ncbi:ABC transporter substrate-binding protein [Paenibacillus physcomitrellae]|uniref:ABC transporter substrate-binding protein n=1 Tax=Paenibacillus physcomitrellae TaxID=1619311 RepID=A0ABQ1GRT9_9BACL|nr:extracellular solute-binding protein [Paenibacillus physcomitrellae]GGA48393.1 ABC transporter substrate-binding protein [Paenibacillus physcomitrellae]